MPKRPYFQGRHIVRRNDDGSIDYCESSYSLSKQEFLQEFVRNHATAMAAGECYIFVDCHGGLGNWRDKLTNQYCNGSPVVFYTTLESMSVPYRGLVFEIDTDRSEQLEGNLYHQRNHVTVHNEDNCRAPERLRQLMYSLQPENTELNNAYMYGLIYFDFTGFPRISEMECVAEASSLDLLIHFSTSWWKAYTTEQKAERINNQIFQRLDQLQRRYWYVSDPQRGINNRFNFTFLHGTNIQNRSIHSKMAPVDSDEGRRRLIVAQNSKREILENELL